VLAVLRVAEAVNRLAPHLSSWLEGLAGRVVRADAPPPGHLPRDAFLSAKLAPKLGQQLKDVLSICGGALPPWCSQLVHSARFLFPFEARRRFFHCTSFGLPRALHYLQQVHAAEHGPSNAADREAAGNLRIGRVQRQKVGTDAWAVRREGGVPL
jgi:E3 ubiquitin-protein ligase TRIP12